MYIEKGASQMLQTLYNARTELLNSPGVFCERTTLVGILGQVSEQELFLSN